ncbi:MAG TPA: AAA domain-containing protein, partial [Thermoleophilia bacterium]|nr:AAA domain-containing protein [Thermoleophilia bacterium]
MNRNALEAELRGALEEEIAHLQRTQSERTVAATGGSRSGAAGPWVLYTFLLERDFLVPDATPVMAQIGNERLNAQIIAIQGMEITLALQQDLGPTIARVEISVDPTAILERILTRLEDPAIAGLSDTLARMAFGYEDPRFGQVAFTSVIDLSDDNRLAVERAIGSQVQFIWGPPGTGKTQALAALCEVLVENGESVLLTSHTNVAVDEAILRAAGPSSGNRKQGPLYKTPAYLEGKLLRYGPPKHVELEQIIEELSAEAISRRLATHLEARLAEIDRELAEIGDARSHVDEVLEDWRKAEHFAMEVRNRERALEGTRASLNRRRQEHDAAGTALTQARARLEDAQNPRGLRRLFRKDPRPFQLAVRDADRALRLASESLSAAEARELEASSSVDVARAHASQMNPAVPKEEALRRVDILGSRAAVLDEERNRIQSEIDGIIATVIRDAQLVGTTLTRAATDDVLTRRRFDTVIIDEASMAPLPLVYLAALLAEKRVILVGDFQQLPPIVQSPESSELAYKWLGRDIFCQAGIDTQDLPQDKHDWRTDLMEQHRMAPAIRQFASERFYGSKLRDSFDGDRLDDKRWAERPPTGRAVSLVDTTSLGAWSQRSPGARPSKFNIYSALVATELAELLVQDVDKENGTSGSRPVGIITPYRAQANLLKVLLEERGLEKLVHAGTVHSFQGTESEVIIFDYVEDEPYWKAGPLLLGQGDRLMNVAVTRARHRLFVLGSYAHVRQQLKRSRLWDLVDYA